MRKMTFFFQNQISVLPSNISSFNVIPVEPINLQLLLLSATVPCFYHPTNPPEAPNLAGFSLCFRQTARQEGCPMYHVAVFSLQPNRIHAFKNMKEQ